MQTSKWAIFVLPNNYLNNFILDNTLFKQHPHSSVIFVGHWSRFILYNHGAR